MATIDPTGDLPELRSLRSQIRDLAALLALSAMWRGRELPFIASSLLEALVSLLRLDIAYLRLENPSGGPPLEEKRPLAGLDASTIGALLERTPASAEGAVYVTDESSGYRSLRVVRFNPRLDRERGVIIVGCRRENFPTDVESFLLRIAVEQGMVALQGSRLLRDLQTANRAKSEFLATMSHELRTPLNAILGYVDLLDAGVSGQLNPQQRQNLARVRAGSHHLLELIEGILAFARIDAGREEVARTRIDLCELVAETAALVRPMIQAKNLEFAVEIATEKVEVETDSGKVRQILLNLLSNSVKFTGHGSIGLVMKTSPDAVWLIVRDTGIGIPESELVNIFEPFRQVGRVYTDKSPGTGLGLSVSRHLAQLLAGDITVESVVGEGSTFTVVLPIKTLGTASPR